MKKKNIRIPHLITVLMMFLALEVIGCQPFSKGVPTSSETGHQTTLTLALVSTTPTVTQIPVVSIVTKEPTLIPTLALEDARKRVTELLETNNNCQLPCWWGITPNKTLWQDAVKILAPVSTLYIYSDSKSNISTISARVQAPTDEHGDVLFQNYVVEDGVVKRIDVYNFDFAPFTYFKQFVHEYGVPDQTYIRGYQDSGFELALFYPEKGILAVYNRTSDLDGQSVKTCFENDKIPFLYLWSPDQLMNFDEVMSTFHIQMEDVPTYHLIEETLNNLNEFKSSLTKLESQSCIETPADLWPPQGIAEQVNP